MPAVIEAAQANIALEVQTIQQLSEVASKQPYYRFNYAWNRQIEAAVRIHDIDQEMRIRSCCYSASRSYSVDGWVDSANKLANY